MPAESEPVAYDTDVAAWAHEQAAHLRFGAWAHLDVEQLADEVEALARPERHVLTSALRQILLHLLRWDHQPGKRTRGWSTTIRTQRWVVAEQREASPSLKRECGALMLRAYRRARIEAAGETSLDDDAFPPDCRYGHDEVLTQPIPWPPARDDP